MWTDPEFDPASAAFYYARVLEVPTCRWSTRACNARGVRCAKPGDVPERLGSVLRPALSEDDPGTRLDVAHLVHAPATDRQPHLGGVAARQLMPTTQIAKYCAPPP